MSDKRGPVHEVKVGRVRAAVWANEAEGGTYHTVKFSRLYKDKDGRWQDTGSFSKEDLPLLIKAADLAHTWLYCPGAREEDEEAESCSREAAT